MKQAPPPPSGEAIRGLRAFLIAVLCGGLAAGAPAMLLTAPFGLALMSDGNLGGLLVMFSPVLVAVPVVLGASLLIGLPLTAILRAWNREAGEYYIVAGLIFGAVPFLVLSLVPGAEPSLGLLMLCGALGGGVTSWHWARYRDGLRGERTE